MTTGRDLREFRQAKGVGLDTLARKARISKGHLSRVERGERPVTPSLILAYDKALGGPLPTTTHTDKRPSQNQASQPTTAARTDPFAPSLATADPTRPTPTEPDGNADSADKTGNHALQRARPADESDGAPEINDLPGWALRIRAQRRDRLWTQREMAKRLADAADERTRAHLPERDSIVRLIKGWEAGRHHPRDPYRVLYGRAFDTHETILFGTNARTAPHQQGPTSAHHAMVDGPSRDQASHPMTATKPGPLALTPGKVDPVRPTPELDEIADIAGWLDRGNRSVEAIADVDQAAASLAATHADIPPKSLLQHVIGVHRQARDLLTTGDLRFSQVRELLRIDADVIAHAAVLLGDINRHEAAEEYALIALRLAREVGADQGFSWYARAKTARWRGHYVKAADLARHGYEATPTSPMRLQLAWYEASAAALLGDMSRAREAVKRARELADSSTTANADRSVWSFPTQRQTLFTTAVAVRTGDPDGALRTVAEFERTAAADSRPSPANWAQIKVAAGLAYIVKDDMSGVIHEVTPVLTLPPEMRVSTVTAYLDDMSRTLAKPRYTSSPDIAQLRQRIREFNAAALPDDHATEDR